MLFVGILQLIKPDSIDQKTTYYLGTLKICKNQGVFERTIWRREAEIRSVKRHLDLFAGNESQISPKLTS